MTRVVDGLCSFGPLGLACLALISAPPPAVRAQIVGAGLYTWGSNSYGELGNGNASPSSTPVKVTALSAVNVTAVAGGAYHTLAASSAGAVYTWGYNADGELGTGDNNNSTTPILILGGGLMNVTVTGVAAGGNHSLAVTNTGAVYDWGQNNLGQLGNGTTTNSSTPGIVTGLAGITVTAIAAGNVHSLAATSTGAVYAWGFNGTGQLGTGNTTDLHTPTLITGGGLSGVIVTAVAGGGSHSLAVTSTGAVYAWGYNFFGQVGDGTVVDSYSPYHVTGGGLSGVNVKAVAAGQYHSLALTSTGAVYAWGYNSAGQLGTGNVANSSTPLLLSFPPNGAATVVSISAGAFSSFARESDGSLWAWGDNSYGQYGNGTTTNSLTPVEVFAPGGGFGISPFAESEVGYHSLAIVTQVPEPSSLCLVIGIAGIVGAWRVRRAAGRH